MTHRLPQARARKVGTCPRLLGPSPPSRWSTPAHRRRRALRPMPPRSSAAAGRRRVALRVGRRVRRRRAHVAVGNGLAQEPQQLRADPDFVGHCAETDGGLLFWEEVAPEEDPGVVYVVVPKGEAVGADVLLRPEHHRRPTRARPADRRRRPVRHRQRPARRTSPRRRPRSTRATSLTSGRSRVTRAESRTTSPSDKREASRWPRTRGLSRRTRSRPRR